MLQFDSDHKILDSTGFNLGLGVAHRHAVSRSQGSS